MRINLIFFLRCEGPLRLFHFGETHETPNILSFIIIGLPFAFADDVVNVYSARHYDTDMAMYERFTEETGIKVNLIEGSSDALIERIKSEDQFSPPIC